VGRVLLPRAFVLFPVAVAEQAESGQGGKEGGRGGWVGQWGKIDINWLDVVFLILNPALPPSLLPSLETYPCFMSSTNSPSYRSWLG
jgi:hypothetical protein